MINSKISKYIYENQLSDIVDLIWLVPELEMVIKWMDEAIQQMKDPQNHKHYAERYTSFYLQNQKTMIQPLAQFIIDLFLSGQIKVIQKMVSKIFDYEKISNKRTYYMDLTWVINKLRPKTTYEILTVISHKRK